MALKETALNIIIRLKDLTKQGLDKFRTEIKDTNVEAEKAGGESGGLAKMAKRVGALVGAAVGFAAVKNAFTAVLSTGDKFEKLAIQMRAVMGSIEEGDKATGWIKDFATNTPLQLEGVTDAFLRLKNFGLDPMDGTLQAIVDQNEKLGGGQERLIGIANALGQANAKGKLQAEEMLQLIERGVPVYELLSKATGKTAAEIQDMSAAGALGKDAIKALIDEMGKSSTGAAAANMSLLSGLVSNLKDTWVNFLNAISESGALEDFKNRIASVSERIKTLSDDGTLRRWAQQVSDGMVAVFSAISLFTQAVVASIPAIKLLGAAWLGLKLSEGIKNVTSLGAAFGGTLTGGVSKATVALRALGPLVTGLAWAGLIQAVALTVSRFQDLIAARKELDKSLQGKAGLEDEAAQRMAQFAEQTGIAVTSLDDMIKMQEEGTAVFDRANEKWITGTDAIAEYNASLDLTSRAVSDTADAIKSELELAVESATTKFQALTAEGEKSGEALDTIFKDYDLTVTQDVGEVIAILADLAEQGLITADTIKERLGAALKDLSANELSAFAINAQFAFEQGINGADEFATTINETVTAALKNLNVDLGLVTDGISDVGQEAIRNFGVVADNIAQSGDAADIAGKKIIAAFQAAFAKVKTDAGKKQLLEALRAQLVAGTIDATQYAAALKSVGDDAEASDAKINGLTERLRVLRSEMAGAGEAGAGLGDGVEAGAAKAGSAMAFLIDAIEGYRAQLQELSSGAAQAFDQLALGAAEPMDELEALQSRLKQVSLEIGNIRLEGLALADTSGMQGYLKTLRTEARKVEEAFLEQTIAARRLFQSFEDGSVTQEDFIRRAQQMVESSDLLNDQDLSNLTQGIQRASQEMDRLSDSTDRALGALQDKLDRLRGNIEAVEQRNLQRDIATLEAELEQARFFKNKDSIADLEASLKLTREIYDLEAKNRAEDKAQKAAQDQAKSRTAASQEPNATKPTANTGAQQVIELKLGGQSVNVSTDNPSQLLNLLAQAGLRTS